MPGSAQQVPARCRRAPVAPRRGGASRGTCRAADQRGERQQQHRSEGGAKAASVDQHAGQHRPDHVGQRRRQAEPAEDAHALGAVGGRAAGGALDRDQPDVGAGAGAASRPRTAARTARAAEPASTATASSAAERRQGHRELHRPVVAVAVGQPAGRAAPARSAPRRTARAARPPPTRLWPSRSACSGAAMRRPAMRACRPIWPTISASSARDAAPRHGSGDRRSARSSSGAEQQLLRTRFGQRLDAAQLARHRARAHLGGIDRAARLVELLLRLAPARRRTCRTRS